jgi:16S rRNA (guanine1207-N2)-methyltransferase
MTLHLVYGDPPRDLAEIPAGAMQASPLAPGATLLDDVAPGSVASIAMVVPPGTIERRCALARALTGLAPGGALVALGPKDKGGARIAKELTAFGGTPTEQSRHHWRVCRMLRPQAPVGLEAAMAEGALRFDPALSLWTQPGVFSWDRIDEGSALLLDALAPLAGQGADLGCGLGLLSRAALAQGAAVRAIEAVELDARALAAARRNLSDPRVRFHWRDVRAGLPFANLDFVVMNPPFHAGGRDDPGLGRAFIAAARAALRPGGVLWMVANRHLPYEAELAARFATLEVRAQSPRFKIVRARA